MNRMAAALVLAMGALALCAPAAAQTADEFYKGKQIRFIVGTAAGQDYDSWARLIARHLPRYLPGNPTFVVENMPGAGHILATNYLFNLAPRDGIVQSVGAPEGARRQWVESGQMRVMFNMEHERVAGLGAPTIFEFIKSEEERQVMTFFSSSMELGRPLMAPPGVPAERIAKLRSAFDAVVKDPAFLQEAAAMGFEVAAQSGEDIAARIIAVVATPRAIVEQAQRASSGD
jgi:tripartite-type tricarboxylate transporter receptor subunit TctC